MVWCQHSPSSPSPPCLYPSMETWQATAGHSSTITSDPLWCHHDGVDLSEERGACPATPRMFARQRWQKQQQTNIPIHMKSQPPPLSRRQKQWRMFCFVCYFFPSLYLLDLSPSDEVIGEAGGLKTKHPVWLRVGEHRGKLVTRGKGWEEASLDQNRQLPRTAINQAYTFWSARVLTRHFLSVRDWNKETGTGLHKCMCVG